MIPDDIKSLVRPVVAHRLVVTPEAQIQGIEPPDALADAMSSVPVPTASQL